MFNAQPKYLRTSPSRRKAKPGSRFLFTEAAAQPSGSIASANMAARKQSEASWCSGKSVLRVYFRSAP